MNRLLGMGGYDISIHALREEGDQRHQPCHHAGGISIHALREEGDGASHGQSTTACYFYPRPPRGGRPAATLTLRAQIEISIHALREEGDLQRH